MGGIVIPTVSMLLIAYVSVAVGAMFASALATAKRELQLGQLIGQARTELEFCSIIRLYYGRRMELVAQVLLTVCLTSLALAQMVVGCQVMDAFIVFVGGQTYGVQFAPRLEVVSSSELTLQPFGTGKFMVMPLISPSL